MHFLHRCCFHWWLKLDFSMKLNDSFDSGPVFLAFKASLLKYFVLNMYTVVSWESEATPSAIPFFKRAYKISPPVSVLGCLALPPRQKSGMILPFEVVSKLKLPKNHINKKSYSSMKTKLRKIWMIFDVENSLWKSNFCS